MSKTGKDTKEPVKELKSHLNESGCLKCFHGDHRGCIKRHNSDLECGCKKC